MVLKETIDQERMGVTPRAKIDMFFFQRLTQLGKLSIHVFFSSALSEEQLNNFFIKVERYLMRVFDSSQLSEQLFKDVAQSSFFFLVSSRNQNWSIFDDLFNYFFFYFNEFREGNPLIDYFKVFFNDSYQVAEIRLTSYIASKSA